jgi:hypothetical protein
MKGKDSGDFLMLWHALTWKLAFQHFESISHRRPTNTDTAGLGLDALFFLSYQY